MRSSSRTGIVEGTDYANKRAFSLIMDDPQLNEALNKDRGSKIFNEDFSSELLKSNNGDNGGGNGTRGEPFSEQSRPSSSNRHYTSLRTTCFESEYGPSSQRRSGRPHLQSADLFDYFSPLQKERQTVVPKLADTFLSGERTWLQKAEIMDLDVKDQDRLKELNPNIFKNEIVKIQQLISPLDGEKGIVHVLGEHRKALKIGLILSGGPAPGGHNVIAGVFDYIRQTHPKSALLGFLGGIDGFLRKDYSIVQEQQMRRFRNSGGFDMFWSGRGKFSEADKPIAAKIAEELKLNGLIIVGGDGSNSNAALLSEYFAQVKSSCCVIGVPKTIDGDLKNAAIECSFGFDTAAKTYSELIGNLCTDACCGHGVWHFVRVMGRSASHLVLECAMQTRPNLVLIGEEIKHKETSLSEIVTDIVNLIVERAAMGRNYGIILVPEGLVGFIPEIDRLIQDMYDVSQDGFFDESKLSAPSANVWNFLPVQIREQLLGDREATGYVQVAKIATERLLILMVEQELVKRTDYNMDCWNRMHHYFGYEGRCAMPSNFDANYCYNLGYTASCLIEHERNGYMASVKELVQDVSMWVPYGVPFCRLMEMITIPGLGEIPGIIRQLVDINSPSFKVFEQVRDLWRFGDYYRCPGPIQFQGPVADITNFTINLPTVENLLDGTFEEERKLRSVGICRVPKRLGNFSKLQQERLRWIPPLPKLCRGQARAVKGSKFQPTDPYARRQIYIYYPLLCRDNEFHLRDFQEDVQHRFGVASNGLRVGVVFLSRQAPGMMNIVWGMFERLRMHGGRCFGFRGVSGLLAGDFIDVREEDLELFKNQSGVDLLGRDTVHEILKPANQKQVLATTAKLNLDGLVLVGSSLAMTEAAVLSNYFLAKKARCKVIGIPATASNNLLHELIETNIGFDTASKLYSSLIGNVLTDAASMPKYWHFVRLMGRQPSNEVLECALQCHPNVVIIAEEYGAGQKTLADVVNHIADVVCARAEGGPRHHQPTSQLSVSLSEAAGRTSEPAELKGPRNFGAVLIPDGLLHHLPTMRLLMAEIDKILARAVATNQFKEAREYILNQSVGGGFLPSPKGPVQQQQLNIENIEFQSPTNVERTARKKEWDLTPWSSAVWSSLPRYIQSEFLTPNPELRDSFVETEVLLSQLVKAELQQRALNPAGNRYKGNFQAVCHYFGYQGRSAMPSNFDATLAFAHGHLAVMCIESGLSGYVTTIRGLCGPVSDWKLGAIPFNSLLTLIPIQQEIQVHPELNDSRKSSDKSDMPIIPNAEINLKCKALGWLKLAREGWEDTDRFCNPGPIQFWGAASSFYHRILHEEQAEYLRDLNHVQAFVKRLGTVCNFGVDEYYLRVACVTLEGLLRLRVRDDPLDKLKAQYEKLMILPTTTEDDADEDAQDQQPSRHTTHENLL